MKSTRFCEILPLMAPRSFTLQMISRAISLSDRILIMRDGRIVSDIDNRQTLTTEHALVADMIGPASNEKTPIVAP